MDMRKLRGPIIIITTILWAVTTVLGWNNDNYVICLVLSVLIMGGYCMIGTSNKGTLHKSFFLYPILPFMIVWIASFILAHYFSVIYAGTVPPLILGFHPSLFCIVVGYWFGGVLTLLVGFVTKRDCWMSAKDWEDYKTTIKALNAAMEKED
jgi:uncharacterized membrane protein